VRPWKRSVEERWRGGKVNDGRIRPKDNLSGVIIDKERGKEMDK